MKNGNLFQELMNYWLLIPSFPGWQTQRARPAPLDPARLAGPSPAQPAQPAQQAQRLRNALLSTYFLGAFTIFVYICTGLYMVLLKPCTSARKTWQRVIIDYFLALIGSFFYGMAIHGHIIEYRPGPGARSRRAPGPQGWAAPLGHEPWAMGLEPWAMKHSPLIMSHEPGAMNHEPWAMSHETVTITNWLIY